MAKFITNIKEIRDKLNKIDLPQQFRLSKSELVTDVPKFIDTSLSCLDVDKLQRIHRPYYDRMKVLLDKSGIEIKIKEI